MEPSTQRSAPPLRVRLAWWFGIYIAAQLPLLIFAGDLKAWGWFAFPLGLAYPLILLLATVTPSAMQNGVNHPWFAAVIEVFPLVLPCLFYLVHLILTWRVQRRRTFLWLAWILAAIALLNLASCASFLHDPPQ